MLTKSDLRSIQKLIKSETDPLKGDMGGLKKDMKLLKRSVRKIEKTTDVIGKLFDSVDVQLHKRVKRIEDHLDLPEPRN